MEKIKLMKNVLHLFKLMGIATMEVKVRNKDGPSYLTFSESKKGIYYNIFLIGLISLSFTASYAYIYSGESPLKTRTLARTVANNVIKFSVSSAVYVLAIYSIRQKRTVKIAQDIHTLHEIFFDKIDGNRPHFKHIIFVLIKNISLSIALLVTYWHELAIMVYKLDSFASIYIINSVFLQYSMVLELMKTSFQTINKDLQKLSESSKVKFNGNPLISKNRLLLEIEKMVSSYASLVELSKNISDFYSELLVVIIPSTFISLVSISHYLISHIAHPSTKVLKQTVSLLFIGSPLLVLAITAGKTVCESKKTGEVIRKWTTSMDNPLAEKKLSQFSNYLLRQNVEFSVYGLFILDKSLIISVIGTMTTYIVILGQF